MSRLKQLLLIIGDLTTLYIGLYLAVALRYFNWPNQEITRLISPMSILFCLAIIIIFVIGLYDLGQTKNSKIFYKKILLASLIWAVLGMLYFYINPYKEVSPKTILILTTVIGFGLISLWRYAHNKFISTNLWQTTVAFAGFNEEIKELINIIQTEPQRGYIIKGIIAETTLTEFCNIPIASSIAGIREKNNNQNPQLIILSPNMAEKKELLQELYDGLFKKTNVMGLIEFYEELTHRLPPFTFSEGWFIANLQEQKKKIYDRTRVMFDYSASLVMGIFFLITFPFIAIAIKLSSPGPIFFKQTRVGLLDKPFTIYKYRTMKVLHQDGSAEVAGPQFADKKDQRITPVGKILRQTRLDEIPQFINILRREMAIIGPRPERPEFVQQILQTMPYFALRHLIKPGLTGWAQVEHGYSGNIDANLRKLEYDLYYIKHRGPFLDAVILLKTINTIARLAGR